jgi:hypothetical protein
VGQRAKKMAGIMNTEYQPATGLQTMDFVPSPVQIFVICAALLAIYLLFSISLTIVERNIKQRRYKQLMNEYRKTGLDPYQVPEPLRDLIPLAKKWEASDAAERRQLQRAATNADKLELSQQIVGHVDTILAWLSLYKSHPATREAMAFESMLHSFQEMQLTIDDRYPPDNEALQVDFARQTPAPVWLPRAARYKPRFLKNLPTWTSAAIGIPVFIVSFVVWGKVWSFLMPHSPSAIGLVVVNFLSASVVVMTLILLDRLYELRQS